MSYDTDDRFNSWMTDIIESAWSAIETYEEYLLNKSTSDKLSKKMKLLYDLLPVDPERKSIGKDKHKKDKM